MTEQTVECCRCGRQLIGVYYLTEQGSPAHYACLTEDERDGVEVYTDG